MGKIVDAVFGGSAKDAARAQNAGTEKAMAEYRKGVQEAKREIMPRFERADEQRRFRTDQAMGALENSFNPAMNTMQQGNMSAQQMLGMGGQQGMNALLGGPVDMGAFQPQSIDFNPQSFLGGMPSVYDQSPEQVARDALAAQPSAQQQNPYAQNQFNTPVFGSPNVGVYNGFNFNGPAAGRQGENPFNQRFDLR